MRLRTSAGSSRSGQRERTGRRVTQRGASYRDLLYDHANAEFVLTDNGCKRVFRKLAVPQSKATWPRSCHLVDWSPFPEAFRGNLWTRRQRYFVLSLAVRI